MWLLYTLPLGANRSKEEVRARTLVGALESIRCGITCVQDMLGLIPLDDANTDVVIDAYREIGLRVVFSPMVWDVPPIAHGAPQGRPAGRRAGDAGHHRPPVRDQLDYLEHQFRRHPAGGTLHWALAPFAPQRCTPTMLQGCAELAHKHDLPVYTHVYETRGQVLIAREQFADHGGSLITYLENNGLLGPRLNIVHSVWISRAGDGPHGGGRRRHRAQPSLQHEAQERHRAGLRPARGGRAARARLRQLQRQRRAERVPGDEDVLPARRR